MFVATAVLTIVLALVFLGAGIPNILGTKTSLRMRDQLQIDAQLYRVVGFLEIAAGGLAVVVTAACVSPADGASWTPEALELLPHPARPAATSASAGIRSARFRIGV